MRRPSFQFYPADWRSNAKLRRCSHAERGIWLEVICLLHDAEDYGILRWPLKDIALAVGCRATDLSALRDKGVLKGADAGGRCEAHIYTPRHAGKDGAPVELIPAQDGPIWYSSRMVRDEYVRSNRGAGTRFGDEPKKAPIPREGDTPKVEPTRREGDGASSSSSSAVQPGVAYATLVPANGVPPCPHREIIALYAKHLPMGVQVKPDVWNGSRADHLRARWREKPERRILDWWDKFFAHCAQSPFLTGQTSKPGCGPFLVSLDWIIRPENFAKIYEGFYHRQEQVAWRERVI